MFITFPYYPFLMFSTIKDVFLRRFHRNLLVSTLFQVPAGEVLRQSLYATGLKNIWAVIGRVVSVAGVQQSTPSLGKSTFQRSEEGHSRMPGEAGFSSVLTADALSQTWTWKNCHFSLAVLGPFMAESLAVDAVFLRGRLQEEGEQGSKSTCTPQRRTSGVCLTSGSAFGVCGK